MKTTAAALMLATSSMAAFAGGSLKDDAYDAPVAYNWTGFYVGAHGGIATGSTTDDASLLGLLSVSTDYDVSGGIYGGHVGYNRQIGNTVFGIEGSLSGADINGSQSCLLLLNCGRQIDWLASVSGRLGYALDRTMVYATAGVAFADVETNVKDNITGGLITLQGDETHVGWRFGLGIEHAVTNNITARVEYAHYGFGDETHNLGLKVLGFDTGVSIPSKVGLDMDTIQVGVGFKF